MLLDINELLATELLAADLELLQLRYVLRNQFSVRLGLLIGDDLGDLPVSVRMGHALTAFLQQVQQESFERRSLLFCEIENGIVPGC